MKTTLEIPDDLLADATTFAAREGRALSDMVAEGLRRVVATAPLHQAGSQSRIEFPILKGGPGKILLTNEIINENEIEEDVQRAFGGHYRLTAAPVQLRAGNQIPALTNAELAAVLDEEERRKA